jgi:hypothetical protein
LDIQRRRNYKVQEHELPSQAIESGDSPGRATQHCPPQTTPLAHEPLPDPPLEPPPPFPLPVDPPAEFPPPFPLPVDPLVPALFCALHVPRSPVLGPP